MVKRALKEEPYSGAYLDSLGWVYYKQNKFGEAEATLRKAVERDSHDPTIHSHLGDVYAKPGRTELAAAEWEKSLVRMAPLAAGGHRDRQNRRSSRRKSARSSIASRKNPSPQDAKHQ